MSPKRAFFIGASAATAVFHRDTSLPTSLNNVRTISISPGICVTHKIAIIFYTMVKKQVEYDATLWAERDAQREKRFEAKLKRQAKQLGYKLVPIEERPAA